MAPHNVYTEEICDEWKQNPYINPFRKDKKPLKVSKTGIYAKLEKKCKKKVDSDGVARKTPPTKSNKVVISDLQCAELRKNPTVNPITRRKLDIYALDGIYKKLLQSCNEKVMDEVEILGARNAIKQALRPILNKMDTIDKRIKFAGVVRKYTQNIESCITVSPSGALVLMEKTNTGIVKELIKYNKRIGSDSVYGIAYKNIGKKIIRKISFASKLMPSITKTSDTEIALLKRMSDLVEQNISQNMPIIYRVVKCINPYSDEKFGDDVHKIIKDGQYYIVMNELADGDLKHFLKKSRTDKQYESVIMQAMISLRTFHKYTGHAHADAHWGNFLIHTVKSGGYWHYQIEGTSHNIYVPNTGTLVVLWDPGLAEPITKELELMDYARLIAVISSKMNYKYYGGIMPPQRVLEPFSNLVSTDAYPLDILASTLKYVRTQPPPRGIINSIPYII